jgi:hypothetical protein
LVCGRVLVVSRTRQAADKAWKLYISLYCA